MKIAIYSPYLDTASGGEKYILTVADVLSQNSQVDVLLDSHLYSFGVEQIIQKMRSLHGLNLEKVNFKKAPIGKGSSFLQRLFFLRGYDWIFYLTDGSIFLSTAKKSVIHFQVPFQNISPKGIWGQIKLQTWNKAIYNSHFTQGFIERDWNIKGEVVYPPVEVANLKPLNKKKYILSVGRFSSFLKFKKHEVMIQNFREISEQVTGWSLHLAGSIEGDPLYIKELERLAQGLPVFFHTNIPYSDLVKLYGESSIYWHAAGFEEEDPSKMEHFGITTVEAMAAGCVPVVINKGGQPEIIENGFSGYLWDTVTEWKELTLELIKNQKLYTKLQTGALSRSSLFSTSVFAEKIRKLVYSI